MFFLMYPLEKNPKLFSLVILEAILRQQDALSTCTNTLNYDK